MIIASQNILNYGVELPAGAFLRLNLAWHYNLKSAKKLLYEYEGYEIFLDVPMGRKKPPNFTHEINDIMALVANFSNIEYVAISNIENSGQVIYYQGLFSRVKIVPKIETYIGIRNARDIIQALNYRDKVIMLDHQDLHSDLISMGREDEYLELVGILEKTCQEKGALLLRTVGVVFSEWKDVK